MTKKTIISILFLISFFLPWFDFGIISFSGFEIPSAIQNLSNLSNAFNPNNESNLIILICYGLYLSPIIGLLGIIQSFTDIKNSKLLNFSFGIGILYSLLIAYLLFNAFNGRLLNTVNIGYISFSILSIIGWFIPSSEINVTNQKINETEREYDIISELLKLNELKEKGGISDELYEEEKIRLENKMKIFHQSQNKKENEINNTKDENRNLKKSSKNPFLLKIIFSKRALYIFMILTLLIIVSLIVFRNEPDYILVEDTGLIENGTHENWIAKEKLFVYENQYDDLPIDSILVGDLFTAVQAEFHYSKAITAKITDAPDAYYFEEKEWCPEGNPFSKGDEIQILNYIYEGYWNVYTGDSVRTAHFFFNDDKTKLVFAEYSGCPRISGDVLSNEEKVVLWIGIELENENNTGIKRGWVKIDFDEESLPLYERIDFQTE